MRPASRRTRISMNRVGHKSLILNSRAIDEINNTPALLDDLVIAQSIIHDLGITDPYIGIRFGKVLRNNN
jgi:hypothetical protein